MRRAVALAIVLCAASAAAQPLAPPPVVSPPPAPAASAQQRVWASCLQHLPSGVTPPKLTTALPARGIAGHEVRLIVVVTHGRGETVLPDGFRVQRESDAAKAIEQAGFVLPDPGGGAKPLIDAPDRDGDARELTTTLSIPFVPLPEKGGRHDLYLPPVPITIARANGEAMTLCTAPQHILVEDPIANEADPKVRPNPPARPQREEWLLAKQVTYAALVAVALAVLLAYLLHRWRARPKPLPVAPRVLPWIAALRELEELKRSGMLDEQRFDEHVDRVNDCVRKYLGDRYGFDGLESTTEEIRASLRRVYPPLEAALTDIDRFLAETDFLKFAEVTATRDDCDTALGRAFQLVEATTPPAAARRRRRREEAA